MWMWVCDPEEEEDKATVKVLKLNLDKSTTDFSGEVFALPYIIWSCRKQACELGEIIYH